MLGELHGPHHRRASHVKSPDSGRMGRRNQAVLLQMFVKGERERPFAYEAHTACDRHGWILGAEVTAGNANDSTAWDAVYDQVTDRFPEAKLIAMDAGCKTPWIAPKTSEDSRIPIPPYTRSSVHARQGRERPLSSLGVHLRPGARLLCTSGGPTAPPRHCRQGWKTD